MWVVLFAVCGVDPATGRDVCRAIIVQQYYQTEEACQVALSGTMQSLNVATRSPTALNMRWVFGECHDTSGEGA